MGRNLPQAISSGASAVIRPNPSPPWRTPPQLAQELGVDPAKVIGWIRSGELLAVNLATSVDGRGRYRISADELASFLRRRTAVPTAKPSRVKRRRMSDVIEFL